MTGGFVVVRIVKENRKMFHSNSHEIKSRHGQCENLRNIQIFTFG